MDKNIMLDFCSDLLDKITVVKGYLNLNMERKNVDYTILLLQEVESLELRINKMIDSLNAG
ncbi:MAG: histidine kinase [Desulfotomaculaceae bacterium]